jgi:hypothetical protein
MEMSKSKFERVSFEYNITINTITKMVLKNVFFKNVKSI